MTLSRPIRVLILHRLIAGSSPQWIGQLLESTQQELNHWHQHAAHLPVDLQVKEIGDQAEQGSATGIDLATMTIGPWDLIVWLDSGWGTWSHQDYQRLQSCWPLASMVTVGGPWASGGQRSGQQWEGSFHLPYPSFIALLRVYLEQRQLGKATLWSGPATLSRSSRLAQATSFSVSGNWGSGHSSADGNVVLMGRDRTMLEAVQQSLGEMGMPECQICFRGDIDLEPGKLMTGDARLWIWDLAPPLPLPEELLRQRESLAGPCILLLGNAEVLLAGAFQPLAHCPDTVVLRKPWVLDELKSAIGYLSFQDR